MASVLPLRKRAASSSSPMTGRPKLFDLRNFRCVERDAGADDDQVLAAEGEQAMPTGFDHDSLVEQGGNIFGEGFGAAHVGDGDLRAVAAQKQCRSQAGLAQSDDQDFFAFEFHHADLFPDFSIVHYAAARVRASLCPRQGSANRTLRTSEA